MRHPVLEDILIAAVLIGLACWVTGCARPGEAGAGAADNGTTQFACADLGTPTVEQTCGTHAWGGYGCVTVTWAQYDCMNLKTGSVCRMQESDAGALRNGCAPDLRYWQWPEVRP